MAIRLRLRVIRRSGFPGAEAEHGLTIKPPSGVVPKRRPRTDAGDDRFLRATGKGASGGGRALWSGARGLGRADGSPARNDRPANEAECSTTARPETGRGRSCRHCSTYTAYTWLHAPGPGGGPDVGTSPRLRGQGPRPGAGCRDRRLSRPSHTLSGRRTPAGSTSACSRCASRSSPGAGGRPRDDLSRATATGPGMRAPAGRLRLDPVADARRERLLPADRYCQSCVLTPGRHSPVVPSSSSRVASAWPA